MSDTEFTVLLLVIGAALCLLFARLGMIEKVLYEIKLELMKSRTGTPDHPGDVNKVIPDATLPIEEGHPIWEAIDRGGGQDCNIRGVIRALDKAGYVIVPVRT